MASVLNPVQHARIWHKEAVSLASEGWDVFVLGSGKGKYPHTEYPGLMGHGFPVHIFPAGMRFLMQWLLIIYLFRKRPNILHLHTPELALPACFLKYILGYKLVYDRHENYPLQLKNPTAYSHFSRMFLPGLSSLLEGLLFRISDLVLIAEAGYRQDVPKPATLIRNTMLPAPHILHQHKMQAYYLIGGTLGARYGTLEGLTLWEALHAIDARTLVIAGICREAKVTEHIYALMLKYPGKVQLYGIDTHVDYLLLQNLMRSCYAMLNLFPAEAWLQGKFPTRFYECMGYGIKMVYSGIPEWDAMLSVYPCALKYQGSALQISDALKQLPECSTDAVHYCWSEDARILLQVYEGMTRRKVHD